MHPELCYLTSYSKTSPGKNTFSLLFTTSSPICSDIKLPLTGVFLVGHWGRRARDWFPVASCDARLTIPRKKYNLTDRSHCSFLVSLKQAKWSQNCQGPRCPVVPLSNKNLISRAVTSVAVYTKVVFFLSFFQQQFNRLSDTWRWFFWTPDAFSSTSLWELHRRTDFSSDLFLWQSSLWRPGDTFSLQN